MGSVFRYLEEPDAPSEVLAWFRRLPQAPKEIPTKRGVALYFTELGPLYTADVAGSPVVSAFPPRVVRDDLWTVGELHVLPKKGAFPPLDRYARNLATWFAHHETVFSREKGATRKWHEQLQGSVRSYESAVYALPSGLLALEAGRVFVADDDSARVLAQVPARG